MGKVKVDLYCYLTADSLTKILPNCSLRRLLPVLFLSNPLNLILVAMATKWLNLQKDIQKSSPQRPYGEWSWNFTELFMLNLSGCPDWSESSLGAHAILLVLSWGGSFSKIVSRILHFYSKFQKDIQKSSPQKPYGEWNWNFAELVIILAAAKSMFFYCYFSCTFVAMTV